MNFPKCKSCGKKTNKHYEPPLLKNLGKIDDHLSKGRQLGAKICKYGLELWDHFYQKDRRHLGRLLLKGAVYPARGVNKV